MSAVCSNNSAGKTDSKSLLTYPLIGAIYLYRWTLAPVLAGLFGGGCRFEPSCSHYAEDALRKYGLLRGSLMAVRRILRCHPWHEGGYDPVE
jgi:putative membrane protein insertion efficiency factor